jgi:hypothetical protein
MILLLGAAALLAALASAPPATLPAATASITLHLHAGADRAFPMFDPVNEARWSPGWRPAFLGGLRVAAGMVFTTEDHSGRATWLLDRYDLSAHVLRYVVFRPAELSMLDISVQPAGPDASVATVAYTKTALDASAAAGVAAFAHHFPSQGPHWESAINAALEVTPAR